MTTVDDSAVPDDESAGREPSEITYDEQFYPARPQRLRPSARLARTPRVAEGEPVAGNCRYVD